MGGIFTSSEPRCAEGRAIRGVDWLRFVDEPNIILDVWGVVEFMKGQSSRDVGRFFEGLRAGFGVIGVEFLFFVITLTSKVVSQVANTIATSGGGITFTLPPFGLLFVLIDIGQNVLVGLKENEYFSVGFLAGDFVMLVLAGGYAWQVSPSITIG
jgi:hypothetical protein